MQTKMLYTKLRFLKTAFKISSAQEVMFSSDVYSFDATVSVHVID